MSILTSTCLCGRSRSVPLPALDGMGEALDALEAEGWGWDARGMRRCPECLAKGAPAETTARVRGPEQPDLFGSAAR